MTAHSLPESMIRAVSNIGVTEGYMPAIGNDFETEALPGALPAAQHSRRNVITASMLNSFPAPPSPNHIRNAHSVTTFGHR